MDTAGLHPPDVTTSHPAVSPQTISSLRCVPLSNVHMGCPKASYKLKSHPALQPRGLSRGLWASSLHRPSNPQPLPFCPA